MIGSIVVVSTVNAYLLIPALFLMALILVIRWAYLKTGRDIKRFEGMGIWLLNTHLSINYLTIDSHW